MEIGRFRVLGELGRGAMGVVYRAQDPKIGRTLAIKSIRLNELTDPEERSRMRERLFREAQSAGILSHPNIVTIYDVSEDEGLAYIFMEFVNGMALDDLLRASPPPTGELVMDLLTQTAAALDYAHKNGIIHRDIKPANIMVHEGRSAKVCDFGVAKIVSQQMTTAGMLMGTPSYMSPEQIEGRTMDGRSDQFALAVMVFDILTKEKPFAGDSLPILLYKICRADPPSASELNTTLGIWVDPVLRKALAKNPDDRYPSCTAFIAELRRALDERAGWMLPGKGMPGEDSTTNSGYASVSDNAPTVAALIPPPVFSQSAERLPAPPLPPPPAPLPPPSHVQSHGSMSRPAPPLVEAIPLPRSREPEPKRSNPLMFAIPAVLVLAAGGFFAYQKMSGSKPGAVVPPPVEKPADPPSPVAGAPKPSPVATKVEPPKPPPATATDAPKPSSAAGPFEVRFGGAPAGVLVTVDADAATACKTPCSLPLPRGRHALTGALDGYVSINRNFEVAGEASVPVDLAESVGFLIVNSNPPGATVSIDGQERPDKTPARFRLKPGTYKLIVSHEGQRDPATAIVKDGSTLTLNVNFQ